MKNILLFIFFSLTIMFGASTITLYARYQEVLNQDRSSAPKNEPTPLVAKRNTSGQIFIVTRGGSSIPLGGVLISIYRHDEFSKIIAPLQKVVAVDVIDLAPRLITQEKDIFSTMERNKKEGYPSGKAYKKHLEEFEKKVFVRNELLRNLVSSSSAERYLAALDPPFSTTQSDASGKFDFTLPTQAEWVVTTCASREVGERKERYCWFAKTDGSKDILLNNNNMFGSMSEDSAIKMPEINTSCRYNDECTAHAQILLSAYSEHLTGANNQ